MVTDADGLRLHSWCEWSSDWQTLGSSQVCTRTWGMCFTWATLGHVPHFGHLGYHQIQLPGIGEPVPSNLCTSSVLVIHVLKGKRQRSVEMGLGMTLSTSQTMKHTGHETHVARA